MTHEEIKKKTEDGTKWSAITEIAAKCVSPVTNMILARLLTPEAFGVVATVTMIVSFADMFTDAGIQKYLIQHDFQNDEELDQNTNVAFWTNLAISVILWCCIAVFRNPLANAVGSAGMGSVIVVASLSLPLTSFSSIQQARFRRDFDFKTLFYLRLLGICIPLCVTVPLALLTKNHWALVIGTLAGNVANAVVLSICAKWKPKLFFSISILKEMFSYSWWILMESIVTWLSGNVGTFIVGASLSTYYLGLYKTSMSTVNQITNLITAATSLPLFAAMSRLKNDRNALMDTYTQFIHGLSFFLCPMGVGIWMYREFVTEFLLGKQWTAAADFIGLWGLSSAAVLLLGTYCNGLYNAVGRTKLSFFSNLLHLVALIPALSWGASHGFESLYRIRCAVRLELVLVQIVFMKVFMKVSLTKIMFGLYPPIVCTLVMAGAGIVLQTIGAGNAWTILSIAICVGVYFAVGLKFFRTQVLAAFSLFGIRVGK